MFEKLQRYISSCEECQQQKQKRGKIPYFHPRIPLSYNPMSYISADIKYMPKGIYDYEFLLIAVCEITGFVIAILLIKHNAVSITHALYHYYETHSVSFINTEDYLIIQILIFFINNKQAPMDLYKLYTVHVPLDKDTYDGKESKYTRLHLNQNHLVISKEEYIDLDQHQLNSCLKLPEFKTYSIYTCLIMCHSGFSNHS